MKTIAYTRSATSDLRQFRSRSKEIMAKIERYAETGAGDVKALQGNLKPQLRLRAGDFRVLFVEDAATITILAVGPRGGIYD